jgi:hypothetical protein
VGKRKKTKRWNKPLRADFSLLKKSRDMNGTPAITAFRLLASFLNSNAKKIMR